MIAAAQQRVFRALDPYEEPFTDAVPSRALLFPVWNPLTSKQLGAIVAVARAAGDKGFFRIHYQFEGEGEFIRLDALSPARLPAGGPEAALVSESGSWGLISDEDFTGLFAATSDELLNELIRRWPPTEEIPDHIGAIAMGTELSWTTPAGVRAEDQWTVFLHLWTAYKDVGSNTAWIPPLLVHVYGLERTREMLADFPEIG